MEIKTTSRPRKGRPPRTNDSARTRADILEVAAEEFATHGLSGARVDAIAERTRTSKRMIYYYFRDKEGLYRAVLENAYSVVRAIEANLALDTQEPEDALRSLVEQTFENDDANEAFIRLVAIENVHRGEHLRDLVPIREINKGVIKIIERILERGRAIDRFRTDLDAIDVHLAISALCFFRVSNKHTFGKIFQVDLSIPALNIGEGGATGVARFLHAFGGAGFQQIALSTRDIFAAVESATAHGVEFLPIPDNYFDDLASRFDLAPDLLSRMRRLGVLYDRSGDAEFRHIYTRTFQNRFFFEVVERRNYDLFGAANTPVRLAAQASIDEAATRAEIAFE